MQRRWEYYKRDWKTREFKPLLGSTLKGYPLDLLDWGKYLVFYIRGKGRYDIGGLVVYQKYCRGFFVIQTLNSSWLEIRINLDTLRKEFDVFNPPKWIWDEGGSPPCWRRGFVPLILDIGYRSNCRHFWDL